MMLVSLALPHWWLHRGSLIHGSRDRRSYGSRRGCRQSVQTIMDARLTAWQPVVQLRDTRIEQRDSRRCTRDDQGSHGDYYRLEVYIPHQPPPSGPSILPHERTIIGHIVNLKASRCSMAQAP